MGSFQSFLRITMLFALAAVSLSAMAFERDQVPGEKALSAFRNSEDCGFYAVATEKTRAAEASMRAERSRLAGVVSGAEAGLKACADANGLDYDAVDEYDMARACGSAYDRWIFTGVQLRLVDDELAKLDSLSDDLALATANRCSISK